MKTCLKTIRNSRVRIGAAVSLALSSPKKLGEKDKKNRTPIASRAIFILGTFELIFYSFFWHSGLKNLLNAKKISKDIEKDKKNSRSLKHRHIRRWFVESFCFSFSHFYKWQSYFDISFYWFFTRVYCKNVYTVSKLFENDAKYFSIVHERINPPLIRKIDRTIQLDACHSFGYEEWTKKRSFSSIATEINQAAAHSFFAHHSSHGKSFPSFCFSKDLTRNIRSCEACPSDRSGFHETFVTRDDKSSVKWA